jgi:hypothetical protein
MKQIVQGISSDPVAMFYPMTSTQIEQIVARVAAG